MRVVYNTEKRALLARDRKEAQRRSRDGQTLRRRPLLDRKRRVKRPDLMVWQAGQSLHDRTQQLVQAGKRDLSLRRDTKRTKNPKALRLADRVVQESRLADPGLAAQDQRAALTAQALLEHHFEPLLLRAPADQHSSDRKRVPGRTTTTAR